MGLTIKDLVNQAHDTAKEKCWHGPDGRGGPTFGESVALAHSELSEALEAYRDHGLADATGDPKEGQALAKPEGVAAELADVLIRIGDTCGQYGIDLEAALMEKLAYNRTRSHRHGGKRL